jgi:hypothetical protein
MPCGFHQRGTVRPLDAGDFAEQRPAVFVDNHNAILPCDEQTVLNLIEHDIVPPAAPATVWECVTRHDEGDCAQPIQLSSNRMIPGAAVWDAYQNPESRSCSAFVAGKLNSPELREFIEVLLAYTSNGSRPSRAESFEKFGHPTQTVHSLHARIDDGVVGT